MEFMLNKDLLNAILNLLETAKFDTTVTEMVNVVDALRSINVEKPVSGELLQAALNFIGASKSDKTIAEIVLVVDSMRLLQPIKKEETLEHTPAIDGTSAI